MLHKLSSNTFWLLDENITCSLSCRRAFERTLRQLMVMPNAPAVIYMHAWEGYRNHTTFYWGECKAVFVCCGHSWHEHAFYLTCMLLAEVLCFPRLVPWLTGHSVLCCVSCCCTLTSYAVLC